MTKRHDLMTKRHDVKECTTHGVWSTCKALRHIRSVVHEWPEDNHESDENIESTQRTSLAAFSSGTVRTGPVRRTLESPFEWVPEQLSRFLTDPTIATLLEHPGQ